jgi:hypothetical protein
VGRLVCEGTGVAVAVGVDVAVGASVGMAVGAGVAACPQADREKTKSKKQNCTGTDNILNMIPRKNPAGQAGTKFHKGKFKDLCGPLSLVYFVSFVFNNFLFT